MKASEMAKLAEDNKHKVEAAADKELEAICTNIRAAAELGAKATTHVIKHRQNELQLAAWGYSIIEERNNVLYRQVSGIFGETFIIRWD